MTSHDEFTSGISRVLTVSSLQRLKLEALIPAPADFKVRSVIKLLKNKRRGKLSADTVLQDNARPHTVRRHHISCRSSAGRCLIIHPIVRTSRPVISIFSYTSRNSCPICFSVFKWHRDGDECRALAPIPGGRHLRPRDT